MLVLCYSIIRQTMYIPLCQNCVYQDGCQWCADHNAETDLSSKCIKMTTLYIYIMPSVPCVSLTQHSAFIMTKLCSQWSQNCVHQDVNTLCIRTPIVSISWYQQYIYHNIQHCVHHDHLSVYLSSGETYRYHYAKIVYIMPTLGVSKYQTFVYHCTNSPHCTKMIT